MLNRFYRTVCFTTQSNGLLTLRASFDGWEQEAVEASDRIRAQWDRESAWNVPSILLTLPVRADWFGRQTHYHRTPTPKHRFMADSGGALWSWAYLRGAALSIGEPQKWKRRSYTLADVPVVSAERLLRWGAVLQMSGPRVRARFWEDMASAHFYAPEVAKLPDVALHLMFEAVRAECLGRAPVFWRRFQQAADAIRVPVDYAPNISYYAGAFIGGWKACHRPAANLSRLERALRHETATIDRGRAVTREQGGTH